MNEDTTELGYLKPLNEKMYNERKAFYDKALQQLRDGLLGDRLRDKVDRVVRDITTLKALRGGQ